LLYRKLVFQLLIDVNHNYALTVIPHDYFRKLKLEKGGWGGGERGGVVDMAGTLVSTQNPNISS
jgi:hypothetical protein